MLKYTIPAVLLLAACDDKPNNTAPENTAAEIDAARQQGVGWRSNNEDLLNLTEGSDKQPKR